MTAMSEAGRDGAAAIALSECVSALPRLPARAPHSPPLPRPRLACEVMLQFATPWPGVKPDGAELRQALEEGTPQLLEQTLCSPVKARAARAAPSAALRFRVSWPDVRAVPDTAALKHSHGNGGARRRRRGAVGSPRRQQRRRQGSAAAAP